MISQYFLCISWWMQSVPLAFLGLKKNNLFDFTRSRDAIKAVFHINWSSIKVISLSVKSRGCEHISMEIGNTRFYIHRSVTPVPTVILNEIYFASSSLINSGCVEETGLRIPSMSQFILDFGHHNSYSFIRILLKSFVSCPSRSGKKRV